MYISNLKLRNWRNFTSVDADLKETVYLIGPNASGKSNLLDIFRFMRDIVNPKGGGLQQAIDSRGGLKKNPQPRGKETGLGKLEFEFREDLGNTTEPPDWCYKLWINYEGKGKQRPIVIKEEAWKKGSSW